MSQIFDIDLDEDEILNLSTPVESKERKHLLEQKELGTFAVCTCYPVYDIERSCNWKEITCVGCDSIVDEEHIVISPSHYLDERTRKSFTGPICNTLSCLEKYIQDIRKQILEESIEYSDYIVPDWAKSILIGDEKIKILGENDSIIDEEDKAIYLEYCTRVSLDCLLRLLDIEEEGEKKCEFCFNTCDVKNMIMIVVRDDYKELTEIAKTFNGVVCKKKKCIYAKTRDIALVIQDKIESEEYPFTYSKNNIY